jgi:hypothetical protein
MDLFANDALVADVHVQGLTSYQYDPYASLEHHEQLQTPNNRVQACEGISHLTAAVRNGT